MKSLFQAEPEKKNIDDLPRNLKVDTKKNIRENQTHRSEDYQTKSEDYETNKSEESEDSPKSPFKGYEKDFNHFSYYKQNIELDIYIVTSYCCMIFIPCFLLFFSYIFRRLCKILILCFELTDHKSKNKEMKEDLKRNIKNIGSLIIYMIIILGILVFVLFPGLFVIITQYFCMIYLTKMEDKEEILDEINILQILLIFILSFMSSQEISQAINTFYFLFDVMIQSSELTDKIGWRSYRGYLFIIISFFVSLIFPIIQITVVILLLKVAIVIILTVSDPVELIQNFAGLYIILEFDNIIMKFMDILPWKSMLFLFLRTKFFSRYSIEKNLRVVCFNTSKLLNVLQLNEIKLNFHETFGSLSYILVLLKILIVIGAMLLSFSEFLI